MNKSVLVIDTPGNCYSCCLHEPVRNWSYCAVKLKRIEDSSVKPDWCPLKPLPEKDNFDDLYDEYYTGYHDGWNDCLREITGKSKEDY